MMYDNFNSLNFWMSKKKHVKNQIWFRVQETVQKKRKKEKCFLKRNAGFKIWCNFPSMMVPLKYDEVVDKIFCSIIQELQSTAPPVAQR